MLPWHCISVPVPLESGVLARLCVFTALLAWGCAVLAPAGELRPAVGPGASKDQVIDAYGWPGGQSRLGAKEILTYPQGTVTLVEGRVERIDFSMRQPWPAPKPRPAAPSPTSVKKTEPPPDFWGTDFVQVTREAARRNVRILALFTGPEWSPASKQFRDEVEFARELFEALAADFVFVRLEFTTRAPLPDAVREQNTALRARFNVTDYPTLLVLSPGGDVLAKVDLKALPSGQTPAARLIAAVQGVSNLLAPATAPAQKSATTSPASPAHQQTALMASLMSARWVLLSAIGMGVLVAFGLYWLVWRAPLFGPKAKAMATRHAVSARRVTEDRSDVPTVVQITGWSQARLRTVLRAWLESEGYRLEPGGAEEAHLLVRRPRDPKPSLLVACVPGDAGVVAVNQVREFHAAVQSAGVPAGWFVAPAGFSPEARAQAERREIVLIDGEELRVRFGDLPPLVLANVLAT